MADSISSIGVGLGYATTSNGSYTALADIIEIDTPKIKKNTYEDKSLDQADRWIPKLGAFVDAGQATFTTKYSGAKFAAMLGHVPDQNPIFWKITVPKETGQSTTGAVVAFAALIGEMGLPFKDDGGRLLIEMTLEVSGAVTFTAGS